MNIKVGKYTLYPCEGNVNRFDLFKTVTRTKDKTKELYEDEQSEGFGMQLSSCIERIIMSNLAEKGGETSLKGWLEEYKKEKSEVANFLNKLNQ